jgi:hypothetical protein
MSVNPHHNYGGDRPTRCGRLNGNFSQHVLMYMNMYLSVKICGGLKTVSANITSVNLHLMVMHESVLTSLTVSGWHSCSHAEENA